MVEGNVTGHMPRHGLPSPAFREGYKAIAA